MNLDEYRKDEKVQELERNLGLEKVKVDYLTKKLDDVQM